VFSSLANPTDLGVFGTPAHWDQILPAIAADPNVGVLMCYAHAFGGATGEALRDALALARAQTGKPVFVVAPGGFDPEDTAAYAARDIPVIADTVAGLEAAGALLKAPGAARPKPEGGPRIGPWPSRPLTEAESLQALSAWGLPVVPYKVAADRAAAVAAAEALGWPVAVKAMTAGVAHKSDHGLVRLNLADAAALDAAAAAFAGAPMIVQAMARGDLEAIIGVSRAAGVGMVLMLGLGGVYAESLGAVCIWPIDAAREALEAGLDASVLGRILQSPRWPHAAVRGQLLEALAAVQAFARAAGEQLDALDVNPLILGANGVIAVDALVMPRGAVQ